MSELISIIVPVYNTAAYLERCVDSILKQTYTQLEIILVDDGSTDASAKMCDAYAEQDDRVKVIHKENGGLSSARNAGLREALGSYIGYVDSDDWIEPDMYKDLLGACLEHQADVAICKYASIYPECEDKVESDRVSVLTRETLLEKYIGDDKDYVIYNSVWSKLFKRELVEGMLFPEGHNSEDIMYTTRSFCRADKAVYIDRCFYNYVLSRADSIMNSNRGERMFRDEIPFWREHIECIRERVSDAMGDYAAFHFYRRLLSYYTELVRSEETTELADRLVKEIYKDKQLVRRVYKGTYISRADKMRMHMFLISPKVYCYYHKIYLVIAKRIKG